ncbi:DMT family transporter [Candidatus Gottesmanbacteria bacterium]|nr:DMT family transporter [Candidatus Gottesmanbacteria bacterium]
MNTHRISAYLMLLAVSVIWGIAGPVIKFTLGSFPPLIFLAYRFAVSSVIATVVLGTTKVKLPKHPNDVLGIFLYSVFSVTIALGLLFFGFEKTTSLVGTVIAATGPLVTVAVGALLLRERVTPVERWGITIATIGTILTIAAPVFTDGAMPSGTVLGNLLVIASVFVDAISVYLAKLLVRGRTPPAALTHISFLIGFLTIAPLVLASHTPQDIVQTIVRAPPWAHAGVWFMAIVSGTVAYTLRNRAVKTIEISEAAVFTYLQPLWAAPLSLMWLGETITAPFVAGAIIIAMGVALSEWKQGWKHGRIRL